MTTVPETLSAGVFALITDELSVFDTATTRTYCFPGCILMFAKAPKSARYRNNIRKDVEQLRILLTSIPEKSKILYRDQLGDWLGAHHSQGVFCGFYTPQITDFDIDLRQLNK